MHGQARVVLGEASVRCMPVCMQARCCTTSWCPCCMRCTALTTAGASATSTCSSVWHSSSSTGPSSWVGCLPARCPGAGSRKRPPLPKPEDHAVQKHAGIAYLWYCHCACVWTYPLPFMLNLRQTESRMHTFQGHTQDLSIVLQIPAIRKA